MYQTAKKLVLLLTLSVLMTRARKVEGAMVRVLYISYVIQFKKYINNTQIMFNLSRKINAMTSASKLKLAFYSRRIDVDMQKINVSTLTTLGIVVDSFEVINQQ